MESRYREDSEWFQLKLKTQTVQLSSFARANRFRLPTFTEPSADQKLQDLSSSGDGQQFTTQLISD